MFELSSTKHLRGHALKLVKHRSTLEVRRNFFTERLINRWNSMDQQALDVDSVNSFKNNLQRLRNTQKGFFEDWSPTNPLAAQVHTGVATPGKWPGKWTPTRRCRMGMALRLGFGSVVTVRALGSRLFYFTEIMRHSRHFKHPASIFHIVHYTHTRNRIRFPNWSHALFTNKPFCFS